MGALLTFVLGLAVSGTTPAAAARCGGPAELHAQPRAPQKPQPGHPATPPVFSHAGQARASHTTRVERLAAVVSVAPRVLPHVDAVAYAPRAQRTPRPPAILFRSPRDPPSSTR
jgi:hypothetical protein